jgi:plasmid stability protein
MATLHVRNVPDELYEELRKRAERDGRSIGAEAIALLRFAMVERARLYGSVEQASGRGKTPFTRRFVARAQELVTRAQELCRELGSAEVTPAHVLLAMLEDNVLRPTLERRGITEESVRAVLPSGPPRTGPAPISAEARQMLEQALLQSLGLSS